MTSHCSDKPNTATSTRVVLDTRNVNVTRFFKWFHKVLEGPNKLPVEKSRGPKRSPNAKKKW